MHLAYSNDRFVSPDDARIPVGSIGFNRGYAAFDFLKVVRGCPRFAMQHVERFFRTMELMRLGIPQDPSAVLGIVQELATAGKQQVFGLKLFAVPVGTVESEQLEAELHVVPATLPHYPSELFTDGGALVSFAYQRFLPMAKSTHYLPSLYWEPEVRRRGALEPLFQWQEHALETARSNVFACIDGCVVTPSDGVLHGITRGRVLESLRAEGMPVAERPLPMQELLAAEEVWISSTTKGVVPIVSVDAHPIGRGAVGPVCRRLIAQLCDAGDPC